ncbi:hypothetical protein D3C78_1150290 [compost metagenome]
MQIGACRLLANLLALPVENAQSDARRQCIGFRFDLGIRHGNQNEAPQRHRHAMMRRCRVDGADLGLAIQQGRLVDDVSLAATVIKKDRMVVMRHDVKRALAFEGDG